MKGRGKGNDDRMVWDMRIQGQGDMGLHNALTKEVYLESCTIFLGVSLLDLIYEMLYATLFEENHKQSNSKKGIRSKLEER